MLLAVKSGQNKKKWTNSEVPQHCCCEALSDVTIPLAFSYINSGSNVNRKKWYVALRGAPQWVVTLRESSELFGLKALTEEGRGGVTLLLFNLCKADETSQQVHRKTQTIILWWQWQPIMQHKHPKTHKICLIKIMHFCHILFSVAWQPISKKSTQVRLKRCLTNADWCIKVSYFNWWQMQLVTIFMWNKPKQIELFMLSAITHTKKLGK